MFPTQRTVRGAALAMSAALGLGGAVAPATLAPATFASVARAQNHTPISSPNLPGVLTEHADERRLRLEVLAQSGDYTLMALGGVSSLQDLQVRLVALSVEGCPVATMLLSPAQLTVSMSDEGYLELSIHQRLNIERGYMVEVINTRTGETASREFVPEYGATLEELTASRQNIFFPDIPGLPPAVIIDANPTPEVSARSTPSPSASEDQPHPTAAPAPSTTDSPEPKVPRASEPVNPTPGLSPQPEVSNLPVENPGEQSRDSDRLLVHPRPAPPQPEEAREATLTISTAELKGSAELQAINVSLQNVRESALGYDVMVFEMPPSGAAVGSPLDTVHVSPNQVHGGSFMTDLKVPGTSLVGGKRYRVVVVGGDSEEELRLLATASFAVSIIQRSTADNSFNPSQAPSAPGTVTVSDAQRPEYAPVENVSVGTWGWVTAPRISVLPVQSTLLRLNPVQSVREQVASEGPPRR